MGHILVLMFCVFWHHPTLAVEVASSKGLQRGPIGNFGFLSNIERHEWELQAKFSKLQGQIKESEGGENKKRTIDNNIQKISAGFGSRLNNEMIFTTMVSLNLWEGHSNQRQASSSYYEVLAGPTLKQGAFLIGANTGLRHYSEYNYTETIDGTFSEVTVDSATVPLVQGHIGIIGESSGVLAGIRFFNKESVSSRVEASGETIVEDVNRTIPGELWLHSIFKLGKSMLVNLGLEYHLMKQANSDQWEASTKQIDFDNAARFNLGVLYDANEQVTLTSAFGYKQSYLKKARATDIAAVGGSSFEVGMLLSRLIGNTLNLNVRYDMPNEIDVNIGDVPIEMQSRAWRLDFGMVNKF